MKEKMLAYKKMHSYIKDIENIVFALVVLFLFFIPNIFGSYQVDSFTYYLTSVLLGLSVTLVWGITGIFSFGQAAFFGISAYAYGIIGRLIGKDNITPLVLIIAVIISIVFAAIVGYFMFYGGINDVFVGLITMCITIALETFMGQTSGKEWKIGDVKLGGYNGLSKIPSLYIGDYKLSGEVYYYVVFGVVLITAIAIKKLMKSNTGYSLIAIRENRTRSELFGYDIKKIQMLVFAAGGGLAGLAGVLYAAWGNYITPSSMSLDSSTIPVVLVAAGGRKNVTATMIFVFFYYWLSRKLSSSGSQYALVILGLLLVLVILFVPDGLIASLFTKVNKMLKRGCED